MGGAGFCFFPNPGGLGHKPIPDMKSRVDEHNLRGLSSDLRTRRHHFAGLNRIDEVVIELHRGGLGGAGGLAHRHAADPVQKGHQGPAMNDTIAVEVFILCWKTKLDRLPVLAVKIRAYQADVA